jgi:Ca-activated chloride channel family protein
MTAFLSKRRACLAFLAGTLVSAGVLAASPVQSQDDDVIRVNTDLVVVNTTVVDRQGKLVRGLDASDFKLFEDSQPQKINDFSAEETPFAAAILLDTSGSMEERLSLGRSAAIEFLDRLRADDVAAVYCFDSKIDQLQDFSGSRDLAPLAFSRSAQGNTMLNDAIIRAAKDLIQRPEKRRAIIVLSDGGENHSRAPARKAVDQALAAGAAIYSVDMSAAEGSASRDIVGAALLRDFSQRTGGVYVPTPGGPSLRSAFDNISEELGSQYTITYRSSNRAHDGRWRAIDVKLSRTEMTARTRKGYKAPKD